MRIYQLQVDNITGLNDRLLRSAHAALLHHLAEANSANDTKSAVALSAAAGILAFAITQKGASLDLSGADAGVSDDDGKAAPENFS